MNAEVLIILAMAIPFLGAVGIFITGRDPNLREAVTLTTAFLLLFTVMMLVPQVMAGERPSLQLAEILPGLSLNLTVEPLGMIFAGIASLLWPINSLYSIGYMRSNKERHQTRFYICFALAITSTIGVAFAGNLFTLFIFYEALTLSTYPLVTHKGTEDAMKAGRTYLGILMSTSIGLLLLAIIWTWHVAGTVTFAPGGILQDKLQGGMLSLLLFLFIFGIGKAALMPIHRWLPAAMVAPTPVSALLHAVAVVKAGVFCVVKVIVYVFGIDTLVAEPATHWLLYVAGFTIITASIIALNADNLKRRLAYSTVSQLSYVIMAVAILSPLSAIGAAFHIAAHAFSKITLFFSAGAIYTASKKTEVSQLNGIGKRMPVTMAAFTVGALSLIGLPLVAGSVSKWYMLLGAIDSQTYFAVLIMIASALLNAGYFVPIIYAAYFKNEEAATVVSHGEAPAMIVIALALTALLTIGLFLFPDVPLTLAEQMMGVSP